MKRSTLNIDAGRKRMWVLCNILAATEVFTAIASEDIRNLKQPTASPSKDSSIETGAMPKSNTLGDIARDLGLIPRFGSLESALPGRAYARAQLDALGSANP